MKFEVVIKGNPIKVQADCWILREDGLEFIKDGRVIFLCPSFDLVREEIDENK